MRNKRFLIFLSLTILFGFLAARAIIEIVQSHTPVVRYDDPVPVAMAKRKYGLTQSLLRIKLRSKNCRPASYRETP